MIVLEKLGRKGSEFLIENVRQGILEKYDMILGKTCLQIL